MKPILLAALLSSTASAASAAREAPRIALDAATLAGMPHEAVDAQAHGQALHCSGVPLVALLRKSGAMPTEPLRGAQLARVVNVRARDGYRVAFSLAELDPTLGKARVFVVDRCDGKPLDERDGPLRLIAPDESRPARWARQLETIRVEDAP